MELPTVTGMNIRSLSAGWAHGGFITDDGLVYAFGRTHSFRDVIRSTNIQRVAPWLLSWMNSFTLTRGIDSLVPLQMELPDGEHAVKLVCSAALSLVLTKSGKVFAFGANGYGQCGIGKESVSVAEPEHVQIGEDGDEVVDVAGGYQHGLAVTRSGAVYSWGKGERGQLGFGTANITAPQEIIALRGKKVEQVSAGFNHSSALTAEGELFLWGKLLNPMGKEESNGDQVVPRLIKTSDPVRLLECSHFHTSFITADNKIWVMGRTPAAWQEVDDNLVHVSSAMHTAPFQVPESCDFQAKDVVSMGKGVDNTSFVVDDGRVYEWNFMFGLRPVDAVSNIKVSSTESGFRYRLLLGNAK